MRKYFSLILLLIISILVPFKNAKGAVGYGVRVNGNPVEWGATGEISYSFEIDESKCISDGYGSTCKGIITVTLNNFNGGKIDIWSYDSENTVQVKLIGNNVINSNDEIGLGSFAKINFIGDGELTINASKPLSYEDYTDYLYINPSRNIITNQKDLIDDNTMQKDQDNETIIDNKKTNENEKIKDEKNNKNNTFVYIIIGLIGLFVLILIFLALKINKLNKKIKEKSSNL